MRWCVRVQAVGRVDPDGSRYLLGDTMGNLHMLVLSHDSQRVVGLKLEALGRISAPSTISYLDSGVVFVVWLGASSACSYGCLLHTYHLQRLDGLASSCNRCHSLTVSQSVQVALLVSSQPRMSS